jgi:hypothetical protein
MGDSIASNALPAPPVFFPPEYEVFAAWVGLGA